MNTPRGTRRLWPALCLALCVGCPTIEAEETAYSGPGDCIFGDQILGHGTFVEVDCNTCSCDDGEVLCTEIDCSAGDCSFAPGVFESLDLLECGASATGTALCNWRLTLLKDEMFEWHYSDLVELGTYRCEGNTMTGTGAGDQTFEGLYDEATDQLTWDGVIYARGQ